MVFCDGVGKTSEAFEDVLDNVIARIRRLAASVLHDIREIIHSVPCKKGVTELFFFSCRRIIILRGVDFTLTDPRKVH